MSQRDVFFRNWQGSTIHILAVGDPAVDVYRADRPITQAWKQATGMAVDLEIVAWPDYVGKVFEVLGANDSTYDVVMAPGFFWLPSFASSGWLVPLDSLLEKLADAWHAYDDADIMPNLRAEMSFGGQRYLLPSFAEVQMIFYRKDWIEEAGVGPVPIPLPVERFAEIARALHNPPLRYGTHLKGGTAESFPEWLPFHSALGGELFDSDERPVFGGQAGLKSLSFLANLKDVCGPDMAQSDNDSVLHLMRDGKLGIVNHWSGQAALAAARVHNPQYADRYGYSYFEHPWGSVWSFGVTSASQNKLAATAYLLWATNAENDRLQGQHSGSPARLSTFAAGDDHPWYPALRAALEHKRTFPSFVSFSERLGALYELVHEVLAGTSSVDAALQDAVRKTTP